MTVEFRVATPHDAGGMLAIYAPYCSSSHVSFEIVPPTEPQMRERIERILEQYPWLVAEIDGQLAGYVYASQHRERAAYRWSVDVAVYVSDAYRRRNVGRALYTTLLQILRDQNYFQAFASITLPNPASVRLHESVGFQPVAVYRDVGYKAGRWCDVGWWQVALLLTRDNPPEPRPFCEIVGTPQVAEALRAGCQLVSRR